MVGSNPTEHSSSYLRKVRKPLIEKRRRDRMNVSIEQLRTLLGSTAQYGSSIAKVDKAEVLENAVCFLEALSRRRQEKTPSNLAAKQTSYRAGFRECTREALHYLETNDTISRRSAADLSGHLRHTCDIRSGDSATKQSHHHSTDVHSRFAPHAHLHFSSTPIATHTVPLQGSSFSRDVISPLPCSSLLIPTTPAQLNFHLENMSPKTSFTDSGFVSPNSSMFSSTSDSSRSSSECMASPAAVHTSTMTSLQTFSKSTNCQNDLKHEAHISTTDQKIACVDSTGRDVTLDMIIKEEEPWRPW